ncbi:addiction module protein [candidate division KSB1 bacterium]|nr:addiction module protein [candidate division KSB1 bacterium]
MLDDKLFDLLENALKFKPVDRSHLIEGLMASMKSPDPEIEKLWDLEALRRYEAYKKKCVKAKKLADVLRKYESH